VNGHGQDGRATANDTTTHSSVVTQFVVAAVYDRRNLLIQKPTVRDPCDNKPNWHTAQPFGTIFISDVAPASSRHLCRQDGGATFKSGQHPPLISRD
jgi:hypothetical protein